MSKQKPITLFLSLTPIIILILFLALNYQVFRDDSSAGPNQFGMIIGAAIAIFVGRYLNVPFDKVMNGIKENIMETSPAIIVLLMVGALSATWMLSGVIPAMIYYGLEILSPKIFLVASMLIASVVSVATGSSWTTSATIGVALIGAGNTLGINPAMTAGAVISGAYFGDKMSPMSDTTNLAPAMAGTDLITHIKYMTITTVPTMLIALLIFLIMGFNFDIQGSVSTEVLREAIYNRFHITPWLFLVPLSVVALIIAKVKPFLALLSGTFFAVLFAVFFQHRLLLDLLNLDMATPINHIDVKSFYKICMQTITSGVSIKTGNPILDDKDLFSSTGMDGMLSTIFLIITAMIFGGSMQAIGALNKLSRELLKISKGVFGLFASTVACCIGVNVLSSDQYLAIVIPGRMFREAYQQKGLSAENLSRTLEDSGTVTSVLIPWNTGGAYHSGLFKVDTLSYLPYAFFNLISPFMTLIVAAVGYKIRRKKEEISTMVFE